MNMQEYINELKIHLSKLPDEDREDAISYYFEYLAEAGPDGAEQAMEKLGTPAELAAGIRADQALQDFSEYNASGGKAPVGKGVKAVWYAGLAAVPRTALAAFVTAIIIVVFFAVMIVLFAAAVAVTGGGAFAVFGGVWVLAFFVDGATAAFSAGCGLVLIGLGIFLFRFAVWCSKLLLYAIAEVFNGIRRKRGSGVDRRQES